MGSERAGSPTNASLDGDRLTTPAVSLSVVVISKDEALLAATLSALGDSWSTWQRELGLLEVIVVDASQQRLFHVEQAHPWVTWIDFEPPPGVRVSIPHQRNAGVRAASGDVIVFTDASCVPQELWLERLTEPIRSGRESICCGPATVGRNVFSPPRGARRPDYVGEAATINLAFRRELWERVGGFDEHFEYGSDVDFTWRLVDEGEQICFVHDAIVAHDWGGLRRQMKRSRQYGQARVRLYAKHRQRLRTVLTTDPVPVVYPVYLLGLPLVLRRRSYLLLLLVPLWRARRRPLPVQVVVCHLAQGVGSLQELSAMLRSR